MTIEKLTEEDRFLLVHGCAGAAQGEKAMRIIDDLEADSAHGAKAQAELAELRERVAKAVKAWDGGKNGGSTFQEFLAALEALCEP